MKLSITSGKCVLSASICFIITALFSCAKNVDDAPGQTDVYAAGYSNGHVVYWKNGVEKILDTAELGLGNANGIAVSNTDVYVVGEYKHDAVYWKNGVRIALTDTDEGFKGATAIAIDGNDVYIAGFELHNNTGMKAVLWKNGIKTNLINNDDIRPTGVTVAGGDVYVSGTISNHTAVYWKNELKHVISTNTAAATAITVAGTDVYVSGRENSEAVYWKNGVKTTLVPFDGIANGVSVSGSDVYVTGMHFGVATLWKNNVKTALEPANAISEGRAIVVNGDDVYIAGDIRTNSTINTVYWKNGVKTNLSFVSNIPTNMGWAKALAVVNQQ